MTTQVTERDKKLLVFLAVFLIVIGFVWLLIKPIKSDIDELSISVMEAQTIERQNKYSISRIPENQKTLAERQQLLSDAAEEYYPVMEGQEIDRLLTLAALDAGFEQIDLRELTISISPEQLKLLPYLSVERLDSVESFSGMYSADVLFTLRGDREKLQSFENMLANDFGSSYISSLEWKAGTKNKDTDEIEFYYLTIGLKILMSDAQSFVESPQP